jgi:hypothetical protein
MKFKTIFFIFNIIIVFSFAFIFVMPLFVMGAEYAKVFWASNWAVGCVFVLVLASLNFFFLANWKLFTLLEREDWPGLTAQLEKLVFGKGRYRPQYLRLLVNAYLVSSNLEGMERLEAELRIKRPAVLKRLAVLFGVPHLLRNEAADCEAYFSEWKGQAKGIEAGDWIEWDWAFTLLLLQRAAEAKAEFDRLSRVSKDPMVTALAAYLAANAVAGDDPAAAGTSPAVSGSAIARERITKRFSRASWAREVERSKSEVQAVILAKLIDDATAWLFGDKE